MQELDADAEVEGLLGATAEIGGAPHGQQQPDALASGTELVVEHLAHEAGGGGALAEPTFELRPPAKPRLVEGHGPTRPHR